MKHLFEHKTKIIPALALFAFALLAIAVFALLVPAPASSVRASAEEETIPPEGGELSAGSYTLSEDITVEESLTIPSDDVTIDLNGHTLSLDEGKNDSVIKLLGGSLTLKSNNGEGEIKGGNSKSGGGVYVGGTLTLSGNVKITENKESNIYLSNNNKIHLQDFTGEVGISMVTPGEFVDGDIGSGTFTADNKSYTVDGNKLKIAKLQSIKVAYTNPGKVFPTTKLDDLKKHIEVTGTNENGVNYIGQIAFELSVKSEEPEEAAKASAEAGKNALKIGTNTILVTATGGEKETATATFEVEAVKPELISIQAEYQTKENVYFDTELEALIPGLTVKGQFEDGVDRTLYHESAKEQYNEEYITERYTLSGNLAVHPEGISTITAACKDKTAEFAVEVLKRLVEVDGLSVGEVVLLEGETIEEDIGRKFVPALPQGIVPAVTIDGKPLPETLSAGIYKAEISFTLGDPENYELGAGTREGRLVVNRRSASAAGENGEIAGSFSKTDGISPEWEFTVKDVTKDVSPNVGDGFKAMQTYEITLRKEGFVVNDPGAPLTVKLLLNEKLRKEENIALYRMLGDGTPVRIDGVTREGDYLVFTATDFATTNYVFAVESHYGVYLALTICFGVLCVAGALLLLWYFKSRKKMSLR